jgi:protein tyrosine phosphatase
MLKRQRQTKNSMQATSTEIDSGSKAGAKSVVESGSWVNNDDVDLIAKTVEDFRLQRLSMVQSLRQFVLCYESVMEWLVEQQPKSS